MSEVWEHSDRSVCTHPGWVMLRGWGRISASFFALFQGSQHLQFVLTEERGDIVGESGWVSLDENLLGDQGGATVAALNVFVRDATGTWRMVCHHGSAISGPPDAGDQEGPLGGLN
jgi:SnoaL-like domain